MDKSKNSNTVIITIDKSRNGSNTVFPIQDDSQSGYTLSWENLTFRAPTTKKVILDSLTGSISPGSVVAIMGASGSGKSTLLNCLHSNHHSVVTINGQSGVPVKFVSRYCRQDDALFGNLTVKETLTYAARFNLPQTASERNIADSVNELIEEFGLTMVTDTIIGTPLVKGCSGGQVRRVSVASQIIGLSGGILLLDEPTSGLDSVAASSLVNSICKLASKKNATILCSIHQPSSETFALFSHLIVLGQGSTIYFGPREGAIDYFESIGFPIPVRQNPSDIYLQLTNIDFDTNQRGGKERLTILIEAYKKSEFAKQVLLDIAKSKNKATGFIYVKGSLGYTNTYLHQIRILMNRAFLNAAKNPLSYWIRVAMYMALAVLMGTTWLRMGLHQTYVSDRLSAIVFSVGFLSFMAVAGIPAFLEERYVFIREKANGLYDVSSYVISNFLVSIPFVFIITISFSAIAYFAMGLQQDMSKFSVFVGFLFLALMVAEAQTVFISVAIPIFVAALAINAFANGLWMVVQGFFVQKDNIPAFWRYSFYLVDFQKYAFEAMLKNEMTGLVFNCDTVVKTISNSDNSTSIVTKCACMFKSSLDPDSCMFTGTDVLAHYGYADVDYGIWVACLVAILCFFKIATYVVLRIQK